MNIYFYPKLDLRKLKSPNPYTSNLEASLAEKHTIVNKSTHHLGVLDLFIYLLKADTYLFNWVEYLPFYKHGKIQSKVFLIFLLLSRISGKKIIWVLHNKYYHNKGSHFLKKYKDHWVKIIFELMIKYSDLIITHSTEGISFIKEKFPDQSYKVKYIIHPVNKLTGNEPVAEKIYDILIWGTIYPYKGIIEFLEYVNHSPGMADKKILIAGICLDEELRQKLKKQLSEQISHIDGFLDMSEIAKLVNKSKYILFTYNSDSVLSSGSLMDSISMGAKIIGPDKGAFKDLKNYRFIETFNSYEEIEDILNKQGPDTGIDIKELEDFCKENSWSRFGEKLSIASKGIL